MRLTFVNFLNKVRPHGKLFRGKNRKVRQITFKEMIDMKNDFEREERNLLLLRHPYLTLEQTDGYMKEIRSLQPQPIPLVGKLRDIKFTRRYSYEDALCHLKVKEAWD
ncbi:uncharacterized protein LOC122510739 [Leptopilina heterotoma]|uniref:uncharacterized protein LOC122510739 n=1 Tax=Leptopilina heterotoma TaxID=63436 RepID=UPI001CAA29C1|nr:uncharacterized protein LOC122510739 [Leptopilina heterotoma]